MTQMATSGWRFLEKFEVAYFSEWCHREKPRTTYQSPELLI